MRVCHVTSVHISTDVRIAVKECPSLAAAGYDTFLVAKGESREEEGVHIIGVGNPPKSRVKRIILFSNIVFKKSLELDCEIYHLHDPELLRFVKKYKRRGKKVIFDSHEDVPAQIEDKYWIPSFLRKIVASLYKQYETMTVRSVDAVVAATPYIAEQFKNRASNIVVINNYPKLGDIEFQDTPFSERKAVVCYAGGINEIRGEKVMVEAMKDVDGLLILAGDAPNPYGGGTAMSSTQED